MECGRYKVIKDIHVYDCLHGQLKMGVGTVFEIVNQFGKIGDTLFNPELLNHCNGHYVRIQKGGRK